MAMEQAALETEAQMLPADLTDQGNQLHIKFSTLEAEEQRWLGSVSAMLTATLKPNPVAPKPVALLQPRAPSAEEVLLCLNVKNILASRGIQVQSKSILVLRMLQPDIMRPSMQTLCLLGWSSCTMFPLICLSLGLAQVRFHKLAAMARSQVWCELDEAITRHAATRCHLLALDTCSSAVLLCSPSYSPSAPASSCFHSEADLLFSRASPTTQQQTAPQLSLFTFHRRLDGILSVEHRWGSPSITVLSCQDILAAANIVAETVVQSVDRPKRPGSRGEGSLPRLKEAGGTLHNTGSPITPKSATEGCPTGANSCGGTRSPTGHEAGDLRLEDGATPWAFHEQDATISCPRNAAEQIHKDSLDTVEGILSWHQACHPAAAHCVLQPAAWSVSNTVAWLEGFGRRFLPLGVQARKLALDGRTVAQLTLESLTALLTCQHGQHAVPTTAMAKRLIADLEERRSRHGANAADPGFCQYCGLSGMGCRLEHLAERPFEDVKAVVQKLCEAWDTEACGKLQTSTVWQILQMLGLDTYHSKSVVAQMDLEDGWLAYCAPVVVDSIADHVIRAHQQLLTVRSTPVSDRNSHQTKACKSFWCLLEITHALLTCVTSM
jgi:hypothetical protein